MESLEYFNSGFIKWLGNAPMRVQIDEKTFSFTIALSYMAIGEYWGMNNGNIRDMIVEDICGRYEQRRENEIVFYGASNFRLWDSMEEDMSPYKVQNHGIGGSTDAEQLEYAEKLLYSFNPKIVFIQTGSNGLNQGATLEEELLIKEKMYKTYREHLPNATIIVMSALPLPKRQNVWEDSQQINAFSRQYCLEHENMYYIDATEVMLANTGDADMSAGNGKYFRPEFFIEDGLHLNSVGRPIWTKLMKDKLAELGVIE